MPYQLHFSVVLFELSELLIELTEEAMDDELTDEELIDEELIDEELIDDELLTTLELLTTEEALLDTLELELVAALQTLPVTCGVSVPPPFLST